MPNSGRDCHAWIKRILASMRESWEILWWASKIRVVSWNEKNKYVFLFFLQESDAKTDLRHPVLSWHNQNEQLKPYHVFPVCVEIVFSPVWSCTSLHIVEKRRSRHSSPWTPRQALPGQEEALDSSSAGKTGCSSPRCGTSCRPSSFLWRPTYRQLSTWHTASPGNQVT